MKRTAWLELIVFFLILLFVYTAISKALVPDQLRDQMLKLAFPSWAAEVISRAVPGLELLASLLLIFPITRAHGLYLSLALMLLFTGYVFLVLVHFFSNVPCSCGGVIRHMSWKAHLVFNVFFLLLAYFGIYLINRERRRQGKS